MDINKFGRTSHITWTAEDLRKEREAEIQMREIKFRAWDKKEKKMYSPEDKYTCGLVILLDGLTEYGGCLDYSSEPEFDSFQWYNKEIVEKRYVLMQFTGLKDKNGTEIYEEDIVEYFQYSQICSKCAHRDKNMDEVKFNALGATVSSYRIIDPQSDISEIEVIGNIHQNPELMEQENG